MCKKVLLVVVVLAMSGLASAANVYYSDAGGSHQWNDNANWSDGLSTSLPQPGAGDNAQFNLSKNVNIGTGDDITVNNVYFGNSTAGMNATLNITGTGKLHTLTSFVNAYVDDTATTFVNLSDNASLTVDSYLVNGESGDGTFNMTGNSRVTALGLWNNLWIAGGVAHFNIGGDSILRLTQATGFGTFYFGNMETLGTGGAYFGDPHMNLTGNGKVIMPTGPDASVYAMGVIADGKFTANGGGLANFVITNNLDGTTTFAAVPEPITMVLLGLGGLFLRGRKS